MSINLISQQELEELKAFYRSSIFSKESSSTELTELIWEALHLEGSLVRAQICLASFLSRGGDKSLGFKLACGVEYFHLASLLLDDLPCMDNAIQRRGHQCMHLKYGEANTILAALSLINRSYTLFYSVICKLNSPIQDRCIDLLDNCLGLDGIVAGQALDLVFKYRGTPDKLNIRKIAMLKTASLFSLCIILPALATEADKVEVKHLNRFSLFSGLSYQIFDDFKDISLLNGLTEKTPRDKELSRPNMVLALGTAPTIIYIERILNNLSQTVNKLKSSAQNSHLVYEQIFFYFENKFNILKSGSISQQISSSSASSATHHAI